MSSQPPITPVDMVDMVDMGERSHLDENGDPRIVERKFVVAPEHAGVRVDHYLVQQIPRLSRTRLQKIIKSHLTRNGGDKLKSHSRVVAGDVLIMLREAQPEPPCPRTFDLLHSDPRFYVISKPSGLPVHASAKFYFNTLTRVLSERFPDEAVQICHRLDRETSGALVVARDRDAARSIKQAFEKKKVRKAYRALVHGHPDWPPGHAIDFPLSLAPNDAKINIRMLTIPGGLPSRTEVELIEQREGYALVECRPITGRQHQIRAHLAAAGFPIVGDKLYNHGDDAFIEYCDKGMTDELLARFELARHALHAARIEFPHPEGGGTVQVSAPLPPDLAEFFASKESR